MTITLFTPVPGCGAGECWLRNCSRALCALLTLFALAGCVGQRVKVDSAWEKGADRGQSFERVLVVGLSPNAGVRCDFESFMTNRLRDTVDAKPSCLLMKTSEPLTLESVDRAVAEYQADAVLTTSLVQSAAGVQEGGSRDTRGGGYYKATGTGYAYPYYYGGYGAYGIPVVYGEFRVAPVVTSVEGAVQIQSMLYSTTDRLLVYQLTTTAYELKSRDDALAAITVPIAERLRRDGLTR